MSFDPVMHDLNNYLDGIDAVEAVAGDAEGMAEDIIAGWLREDTADTIEALAVEFITRHDGSAFLAEAIEANNPAAIGERMIAHVLNAAKAKADKACGVEA